MDVFLIGGNLFVRHAYVKSPWSTLKIYHNFKCQLHLNKDKEKESVSSELQGNKLRHCSR